MSLFFHSDISRRRVSMEVFWNMTWFVLLWIHLRQFWSILNLNELFSLKGKFVNPFYWHRQIKWNQITTKIKFIIVNQTKSHHYESATHYRKPQVSHQKGWDILPCNIFSILEGKEKCSLFGGGGGGGGTWRATEWFENPDPVTFPGKLNVITDVTSLVKALLIRKW